VSEPTREQIEQEMIEARDELARRRKTAAQSDGRTPAALCDVGEAYQPAVEYPGKIDAETF
jgi:hypothetical protein